MYLDSWWIKFYSKDFLKFHCTARLFNLETALVKASQIAKDSQDKVEAVNQLVNGEDDQSKFEGVGEPCRRTDGF